MKLIKICIISILIFIIIFVNLSDSQIGQKHGPTPKPVKVTSPPKPSPVTQPGPTIGNTIPIKGGTESGDGLSYSHLEIKTNPQNVSVYIDEVLRGYTPLSLGNITSEGHRFRLEKEGFKNKSFVTVLSDPYEEINENLEIIPKKNRPIEPTTPKPSNVTEKVSVFPQTPLLLTPLLLILIIGLIALLIYMGRTHRSPDQEQKLEKEDHKAQLVADLKEKNDDGAIIYIKNSGKSTARNINISVVCKIRTGHLTNKKMPLSEEIIIPADQSISIPVYCPDWNDIYVIMKWIDESGNSGSNQMHISPP